MIRACPKCGDYYADASLAFCISDGTPLVSVDPHSESWSAGARVIEVKEQALRKEQRQLKRRRVLMSMMTMLMATMLVSVLVVNTYIYFNPKLEVVALAEPSTPALTPDSINPQMPVKPDEPVPTPSPSPTATLKPSPTPTPTPSPSPTCSRADESREREVIVRKYGVAWRQSITGDGSTIISRSINAGKLPPRAEYAPPKLGALKYETAFAKVCTESLVTVRYAWEISYQELNPGAVPKPPKAVPIAQEKKFRCLKTGETWRCR